MKKMNLHMLTCGIFYRICVEKRRLHILGLEELRQFLIWRTQTWLDIVHSFMKKSGFNYFFSKRSVWCKIVWANKYLQNKLPTYIWFCTFVSLTKQVSSDLRHILSVWCKAGFFLAINVGKYIFHKKNLWSFVTKIH